MATRALLPASRRCLAYFAAFALLPLGAAAQDQAFDASVPRGIRLTPFVGWAPGMIREESWSFTDGSGNEVREAVDMHLAGGPAVGATLELPFRGALHLLGGVTFLDRDDAEFDIQGGERWLFTGSRSVLVRAGAGIEFRDPDDQLTVRRLAATAFVAPFYMLELPKKIASLSDSGLFDSAHHFGLNFGLSGELPFARDRFAVQLGFEDYLTLWNEGSLQRLPTWLHDGPGGTNVSADLTHQLLVRAGLTLRLR